MKHLVVLWKTSNLTDINELVFPYIYNSKIKKWWDEVEVIIWGDSQRAIYENVVVQNNIKKMMEAGVMFHACKKCAEDLCLIDFLESQNIDVQYTGVLLTERLQSDAKVITF
ncbi:hypothetical protein [Peloplasma aerotolerans]|uniref:DsrE family protein n=1 Tax=Peloplasma aerotolerans TaxID=3044389 RepID=A0AAW6UAT1_9MOLU|nr:hypothetical protein [Mariniplasma sp. M4Ah]MDI6453049.1 hypothetical protein [Mariniplasma sp. M4Ah]MDR4968148.1 hypothetical protein [Acholeplasmataceae bacterium]